MDKRTKSEVNYRKHESCGNCASMNRDGTCKKVQGIVRPDYVCDLWTPER